MAEDLDNWKPMSDDFESLSFNSYCNGQTAANMPYHLLPSFGRQSSEPRKHRNVKLVVEGFPSDLTETGLKNLLSRIGCKPLTVKIVASKSRLGRQLSFVDFESPKEAQRAIQLIRSQSIFKLSVGFATSASDRQERDRIIAKQRQELADCLMKPKIDLGTHSAINASNANGRAVMSPSNSETGSTGSNKVEDALTPLAKSNKLLKVLHRPEDDCSFCLDSQMIDHLHFILEDNQVVDPNKLPGLIDLDTTCALCGKHSAEPKICAQCKSAIYCSQKCQSANWPQHRSSCKINSDTTLGIQLLSLNNSLNDSSTTLQNEPVVTRERSLTIASPIAKPNNTAPVYGLNLLTSKPKAVNINGSGDTKTSEPIANNISVPKPKVASPKKPEKAPQMTSTSARISIQRKVDDDDSDKNDRPMDTTDASAKPTPTLPKTVGTEVLVDGEEGVIICFGRTPADFYVQKASVFDSMDAFYNDMTAKKDQFPTLTDSELEVGALVGGIYSLDGEIYRARIADKLEDNKYALYFMDYGNTESVDKKAIKRLPPIYFSCKAQAIHCTIESTEGWTKETIDKFAQLSEASDHSKVKIISKSNDTYRIDLLNKNGESITKLLLDLNRATAPKQKTPTASPKKSSTPIDSPKITFDKKSIEDLPPTTPKTVPKMPSLDEPDSVATGLKSITSFYESVQNDSPIVMMIASAFNADEFQYLGSTLEHKLAELLEGLGKHFRTGKVAPIVPTEDQLVVAKGSDEEYYRSYVLEVSGSVAKVLMFDSGYVEDVAINNVYALDDKFKKEPAYGVLFMPMSATASRLLDLANTKEEAMTGKFIRQKNKIFFNYHSEIIPILDFKQMIEFVKENYKKADKSVDTTVKPFDALPLRQFELNKAEEVLALYQEPDDPKEFYVAGDVNMVEKLMGMCAEYGNRHNDNIQVNPLPRNVYLVKSSADHEWYRAVVNSVTDDKVSVQYIDFGNQEENDIKYVMELTKELSVSSIQPVAIKCRVEKTQLDDKDLKRKIEQAVEGTFLLNITTIRIADGYHFVEVK